MPTYPFEVDFADVLARIDEFCSVVFGSLESAFLVMPRGAGFVDYAVFEGGYEALKLATNAFQNVRVETVLPSVTQRPIALVVLRSMLGFNPSEWAYMATLRTGVNVTQNAARGIDRRIRLEPNRPFSQGAATQERVAALVRVACELLAEGVSAVSADQLHRLDKADTRAGLTGVHSLATLARCRNNQSGRPLRPRKNAKGMSRLLLRHPPCQRRLRQRRRNAAQRPDGPSAIAAVVGSSTFNSTPPMRMRSPGFRIASRRMRAPFTNTPFRLFRSTTCQPSSVN